MSYATDHIRSACTAWMTTPSPLGPVLLARTEHGLAGAWFDGQKHHPGDLSGAERRDDRLLRQAADELHAYFAGGRAGFSVALDLQGSAFQRAVWEALRRIPSGSTRSYGDIARGLNAGGAVRAVGGAVGRNPVSVIVPCHRVIGSGGSLTGYAGGTHRKLALLRLEGAEVMAAAARGLALAPA